MEPATSAASLVVAASSSPARLRTLAELDDDDALVVGRFFSEPSWTLNLSILGLCAAIAAGAVFLGGLGALGLAVGGSLLAGGVGHASVRRVREQLRFELSISADDAVRLYGATATWKAQRMFKPKTEEEQRRLGRHIIDVALARAQESNR